MRLAESRTIVEVPVKSQFRGGWTRKLGKKKKKKKLLAGKKGRPHTIRIATEIQEGRIGKFSWRGCVHGPLRYGVTCTRSGFSRNQRNRSSASRKKIKPFKYRNEFGSSGLKSERLKLYETITSGSRLGGGLTQGVRAAWRSPQKREVGTSEEEERKGPSQGRESIFHKGEKMRDC